MMVFLLINFCAVLLSTVTVVFLLHAHYLQRLQDGLVVSVTVAPALSSPSSCFYLKRLDTDNHPSAIYLDGYSGAYYFCKGITDPDKVLLFFQVHNSRWWVLFVRWYDNCYTAELCSVCVNGAILSIPNSLNHWDPRLYKCGWWIFKWGRTMIAMRHSRGLRCLQFTLFQSK